MLTDTPNIQMNRMVTIATPHDKVPLSGLIPGIPALREMEENVYRNRPKIEFKKLKSLTTVAAGKDIVVPSDSQHGHRIPISSKIPQRHETWDDFGHFSFLEPRGARKIAELLR